MTNTPDETQITLDQQLRQYVYADRQTDPAPPPAPRKWSPATSRKPASCTRNCRPRAHQAVTDLARKNNLKLTKDVPRASTTVSLEGDIRP